MTISEKFKPYPKYKDSGVEWLGKIPHNWQTIECKFAYSIQLGIMLQPKPNSEDDVLVPYFKAINVKWERVDDGDLDEMWASPADLIKYKITKGDLLVSEGGEVGRAGMVVDALNICIIQNALHRVRSNRNSVKYLMYMLKVSAYAGWIDIICNKSTIAHFTGEKFGWLKIALPTIKDQFEIATFLYRETARIDSLITKKERQIELLQEKRAALISHAVTKGLDPSAPMKDSGIDWLGEIPEEWKLKRLKYVATVNDDALGENSDPEYEILYVDISSVDSINGITHKEAISFEEAPSRARRIVKDGDIIISTVRTYLRAISPVKNPEKNLIVSTGFAVIRPKKDLTSGFAAYALRSQYFVDSVVSNSVGVSYPAINACELMTLKIDLPSLNLQYEIATYLDHETGKIDSLISKIQLSIEKLREYRTALISAAVTGKIDVRDWQPQEAL